MNYKSIYASLRLFALLFIFVQNAYSQSKNNAAVKIFSTVAPDTVEQGVPFSVNYMLTAKGWNSCSGPIDGNGFRLQSVSYNTVNGTPYSFLQVTASYVTSQTGREELPGMKVDVFGKEVISTPKTIFVKPNCKYGAEMETAHKWLVGCGMNSDSLCLSVKENPFAADLFIFQDHKFKAFCIVAKKDAWNVTGQPVLAYSTENSLNLAEWGGYDKIISSYKEQIAALKGNTDVIAKGDSNRYSQKIGSISPLLGNVHWGQGKPYNNNVAFSIAGKQGVVGCVPLAVAMIMNFHKWPNQAQSHVFYQTNQKTYKMEMGNFVPEWGSYEEAYSDNDSIKCDNLSLLLSRLGIAIGADYKGNETAASLNMVKPIMCNNFKYSGRMNLSSTSLPDEEMLSIIYKNLDEHRPLLASIDGHSIVCDGYNGDFLHCNFGWYGGANGYYRLKLGNYETKKRLLAIKRIIYGIEPQFQEIERAVELRTAGTLEQQLSDKEKGSITNLKVSGFLNSADIRLLRLMAGAHDDNITKRTWNGGSLRVLDLSDSKIVNDDKAYLTKEASGSWSQKYGSKYTVYDFSNMDEKKWKQFKSDIGSKHAGMFYTRTDDNKYWENYYCTKNEIGYYMFESCTSLHRIMLPESTRRIGSYAFLECWSLQSIRLPEKVEETGEKPFYRCLSLESVEVPKALVPSTIMCEECSPGLRKIIRY